MSNHFKRYIVADSKTRTIHVQQHYIIYTLKHDGIEDYLTYNKVLLDILQMDKLKPFRDEGRLRFNIRTNTSSTNIYLYDLAYACYTNQIRSDYFMEDIQAYYERKSFGCSSIDHADNNIRNNTALNLSMMSKTLNTAKGDIIATVKKPLRLNSIFVNDEYRVQLLFELDHNAAPLHNMIHAALTAKDIACNSMCSGYAALNFICKSASEYVECLRWLTTTTYDSAAPIRDKKGTWIKNGNECWCANIHNSLQVQTELLSMPTELFNVFSNKEEHNEEQGRII